MSNHTYPTPCIKNCPNSPRFQWHHFLQLIDITLNSLLEKSSTVGKNQPIAEQSNPLLLFLRLSQRLERHITEPSLSSAFRPWKWLLVPHRFRHQTPENLSGGGRTVSLPVQHSLDFKQSFSLWVLTRAVMGEIRRANLELFRRV